MLSIPSFGFGSLLASTPSLTSLNDAIATQNVEAVRNIIATLPAADQVEITNAERKRVEALITALLENNTVDPDTKTQLLIALAGYRGFNRNFIPHFVFEQSVHDAQQLIRCFEKNGTALRIPENIAPGTVASDVSDFVKQRHNDRLAQYVKYRAAQIKKHVSSTGSILGPYFYKKRNLAINLNGAILGTNKDNESVPYMCTHISALMRNAPLNHPQFKERLNAFAKKDTAARTLDAVGYESLKKLASSHTSSIQCSSNEFGKLLYQLAGELKADEAGSYKLSFKDSATGIHAMTMHIYKKNGLIGVAVHDPNRTANMKHMKYLIEDKEGISKATLKQFMSVDYPIPPDTFSVLDVPKQLAYEFAGKLVGQDLQGQVDSIWDALRNGNAAHIRAVCEQLKYCADKSISGRQILKLLHKKTAAPDSIAGLYMALQDGHADAVEAFGELLKLVPQNALATLLEAFSSDGAPGLSMALNNNQTDAVKAFGKLLNLLPDNERSALLAAATNCKGISGLYIALQNGYPNTVRAFGELLKLLPESERATLLTEAINCKGNSGLYMALQSGNADTVNAFGELLKLLPESERAALLTAAINWKGVSGLYMSLKKGRAATVQAFGELLKLIPDNEHASLLTALNEKGVPGLFQALKKGNADAVKAFGELLTLLPESKRAALLAAAIDANGVSGLYIALKEGHADTVEAFAVLLRLIPANERAALLAARNADGAPGFFMALQKGNTDTVKAFGVLLELIPGDHLADLLVAQNAKRVPGLYMALLNGHADAVKAFRELLKLVPQNTRTNLLKLAITADGVAGLYEALTYGYADTVDAFGELLKLLPESERGALLAVAAINAKGESGRHRADQNGHTDAVKAFGKLLELLPESERDNFQGMFE